MKRIIFVTAMLCVICLINGASVSIDAEEEETEASSPNFFKQACRTTSDCGENNSPLWYLDCIEGMCQCPDADEYEPETGKCVSPLLQPCHHINLPDGQRIGTCGMNAECKLSNTSRICRCMQGYFIHKNKCMPSLTTFPLPTTGQAQVENLGPLYFLHLKNAVAEGTVRQVSNSTFVNVLQSATIRTSYDDFSFEDNNSDTNNSKESIGTSTTDALPKDYSVSDSESASGQLGNAPIIPIPRDAVSSSSSTHSCSIAKFVLALMSFAFISLL